MPVILDPDGYDLWLDPGMKNVSAAVQTVEAVRCPADARCADLLRRMGLPQ